MKSLTFTLMALCLCPTIKAVELLPYSESFSQKLEAEQIATNHTQEMKIAYLSRVMSIQQKSYEEKIAFLETELRKTKDRLIEKSLNQEKIQDAMKLEFDKELFAMRKELAHKTKALLDYQRQVEKMNPSEDMKNMIKINTQLASELRRSEDKIATIQLKMIESTRPSGSGARLPASVIEDK